MPEVIDLLSSSPPKLSPRPTLVTTSKMFADGEEFNVNSDVFRAGEELDFLIEQPAKRRRTTPSPVLTDVPANLRADGDGIFDLSSESDGASILEHLATVTKELYSSMPHSQHLEDTSFHFSSSAPEPMSRPSITRPFVLEISSDAEPEVGDPIQSSSQPNHSSRPVFTERTANLLAGLRTSTGQQTATTRKGKSKAERSMSVDMAVNKMGRFKQVTKSNVLIRDEIADSSQLETGKSAEKTTSKRTKTTQTNTTTDKATSKAQKQEDKEAERERKRSEKEAKAREKQKAADIAKVNKSKTNKKNSTSEMILDMPASLQKSSVGNQVEEYMRQLEVPVTFSRDDETDLSADTGVLSGHIIRWRRKVVADFDDDLEIWKPLPEPRITHEEHIIVFLKCDDFVNLAVIGKSGSISSVSEVSESSMKANLDAHVKFLRTRYPQSTIIYLIEGLAAWNRKSQTVKNRAYTAAVRSQILDDDNDNESHSTSAQPGRSTASNKRKRNKPSQPVIDFSSVTPDTTESLLLHLQLHHQPLLIHHTTSPATTASQIMVFTQHLSTRPYRLAEQRSNLASASFCMTTGQIRTGTTPHETYIQMLQEINRVTPSMAYGISAAGWKSVGELRRGFAEKGNLMLEDVRKSVNRDGAWSDRRLGPMVSKRLYKVVTGRDPRVRDGIA